MRRSKSSKNSIFSSIRESLIVALSFAMVTFFMAALTASSQGFKSAQLHTQYDSGRPSRYDARLNVGTVSETVEVTAVAPQIETTTESVRRRKKDRDKEREKKADALAQNGASSNVLDLQKRVAGVLLSESTYRGLAILITLPAPWCSMKRPR
jgi:hypothetical protein